MCKLYGLTSLQYGLEYQRTRISLYEGDNVLPGVFKMGYTDAVLLNLLTGHIENIQIG